MANRAGAAKHDLEEAAETYSYYTSHPHVDGFIGKS
jgi:hypothetical protein